MTLFEVANELQLRIEAARTADEGDQLLSRGRTLRAEIEWAAKHLEAIESYRITIGRTDTLPLDTRAIRQAIGGFRRAASRSGPKAVQQQPAATIQKVLTAQIKRVDHWVMSTWREYFDAAKNW